MIALNQIHIHFELKIQPIRDKLHSAFYTHSIRIDAL